MAGTFSQIYIQTVFAVKNRGALIRPEWETELFKYIRKRETVYPLQFSMAGRVWRIFV